MSTELTQLTAKDALPMATTTVNSVAQSGPSGSPTAAMQEAKCAKKKQCSTPIHSYTQIPKLIPPLATANLTAALIGDPLCDSTMAAPPALSSTPNLIKLSIPADVVRPNEDVHDQLFTPSLQLDSSFAPPDLSLPDLPYESSPSPAYSPTPPAAQISGRGPCRDRPDTLTVHD